MVVMNRMDAWQILFKGGPMMWIILLLSIVAVAICINRLIVLSAMEQKLEREKDLLLNSLRQGQLKETLRLCEQNVGVLAGILKSGILKFSSSPDLIKAAMEEAFDIPAARLKDYLDLLAMIVNLAPLLGLLGTVSAMTVVFHAAIIRSNVLTPVSAGDLAAGVWQALLTTSAGLMVAIFAFALHGFIALRVNAVLTFVQRSITEMADILAQLSELKRADQGHEYEG